MQPPPEDNTSFDVVAQVRLFTRGGRCIHTESAREIAAWFASSADRDRGHLAFATTGEILPEYVEAIRRVWGRTVTAPALIVCALSRPESLRGEHSSRWARMAIGRTLTSPPLRHDN